MNVLIVGLGSIAMKHIAALHSISSDIQIFALRSSRPSTVQENVSNLYSLRDAGKYSFDFAIISNPTSEHQKSIEQLLVLNIPLFIEKPLFHQLSIQETVTRVMDMGILTYVACNLRFLECLQFTKRYLETHKVRINEVNVYCGSYLPDWRKNVDYKQNYSAIPSLGGGVHIDLIHEIDYLYWLFGIPLFVRKSFSNHSSLDILAYDYANYNMDYQEFTANVILNYYRKDSKRSCEIVCQDDTVYIDLLQNIVFINGNVIYKSDERIKDTYSKQLSYFIGCVKSNRPTFNTIEDAYNVLQICL